MQQEFTEFSEFMESNKSLKHEFGHMGLAGALVASWSLISEVASLNSFTIMTNIFVTEFSENI